MALHEMPLSELSLSCIWLLRTISVLITYTILLGLYRLTWHSLAQFPGPKLSAATGWYEALIDIFRGPRKTFAFEIERMHQKYGSIVRINPHELHVSDPAFFNTLYAGGSAKRNKHAPAALLLGMPGGVFGTEDHDVHRVRRAALERPLSRKSVAVNYDMFCHKADLLCDVFRSSLVETIPLDTRVWLLAYATDCFEGHMFRESGRMELLMNPQKAVEWKKSIVALLHWTPVVRQLPWIILTAKKLPVYIIRPLFPELAHVVNIFKVSGTDYPNTYSTEMHNPLGNILSNLMVFRTYKFKQE